MLLKYAASSDIKGFVFLSSLEVYGTIIDDNEPVTEDVQGYLDPMSVRSSYPRQNALQKIFVAFMPMNIMCQ